MDLKNTSADSSPTGDTSSASNWKTHLPYHIGETAALFADDAAPFPFLTSLKFTSAALNGSQHIQALEQTLGLIDSILQPHWGQCLSTMPLTDPLLSSADLDFAGSLSSSCDTRPKSFLHDEMNEFNQIFSELVASPQRRFLPFRDLSHLATKSPSSPSPSATDAGTQVPASVIASVVCKAPTESNVASQGLMHIEGAPLGFEGRELTSDVATSSFPSLDETVQGENHTLNSDPVSCSSSYENEDVLAELGESDTRTNSLPHQRPEGRCITMMGASKESSSSVIRRFKGFGSLDALEGSNHLEDKGKIYEPMNEDDADSGYMTGDSSVLAMVSAARKLERIAVISREDLLQRIERFNLNRHGLVISLLPDSNVFQGNIRVHMNLYRPIKMSLSSRPSSIYDILIRSEARLPESESNVAFFRLPHNTFKAIHITSETTTSLVIKTLLNKFNITDNPKRFALYERIIASQEEKNAKVEPLPLNNTLSSVRRLADDDRPLELCLHWADQSLELLDRCQFVLQENDPGEILWDAFSLPELNNFLLILAKEEYSYAEQIRIKYRVMKREMERKLRSLEDERKSNKIS